MEAKVLEPSSRYMGKMFLTIVLVAVAVMALGFFLSILVREDDGPEAAGNLIIGTIILDLIWLVPAVLLTPPYFRSLRYEIHDDEVIVRVGIWTRSVKHVPYRTVTNLKVNRDIFDRWFFGLGSLNIQTAGMSGKSGAEESLVGLPDVDAVYDVVGKRLRQYRGAMSPNAAGVEGGGEEALTAILAEVRGIRESLNKQG